MSALLTDAGRRLVQIERALRARQRVTFRDLRQVLNASPATVKRDLMRLRGDMGAVIVYDPRTRTYTLHNPSWPGVLPAIYAEAA